MTSTTIRTVLVCCALVACGDDGGSDGPQMMVSKDVGTDGGTVTLAGGPTLTIPANALAMNTTITITDLGEFGGASTSRYKFEPDGLTFSSPATIEFPIAPAASLRVFWTKAAPDVGYDELTPTAGGSTVSAQIMHFSNGFVAPMGTVFPVGDQHGYAMTAINIPTTNTQARELGLDLDDDQMVDNQLGMVFSTLEGMGFDLQAETSGIVSSGGAIVLVDLVTTDFANATSAGVRTLIGEGTAGAYEISAMSPNNAYLVGNTTNGTLTTTTRPGHAVIQMAFDQSRPPLTLNLIGARARVTGASASGITSGVLAGALTQAEIDATLIPEMAAAAGSAVMRDCTMLSSPPNCGCAAESTGKTYLGLFDTDHNCNVSEAEVKASPLIGALFALDVTVEGQMALSVGFGFTAASAAF